jgi:hypothetical protein
MEQPFMGRSFHVSTATCELEDIFERYYFDARWRSRPASRARCNRMRRPR